MSQLTVTSYYFRKGVKIGVVLLLSFFIFKTSWGIFKNYWKKIHPPPAPPPDTAYGKLPKVNFPTQKKSIPINFELETVEGGLPTNFPNRGKVIYLSKFGGKFSKLEEAENIARDLNLPQKGTKLSENTYLFKNSSQNLELKINVLTQNFTYSYDYIHDQTLINPSTLPSPSEAINTARGFLSSIGKLTQELEEGEKETNYWKIKGEKLVPAISASEADFIKVHLFRKPVEKEYPVMPPSYPQSLVSLLITSKDIKNKSVVEAKYTNFESDREEFAEYPLTPIKTAWDKVRTGEYYLASFDGSAEKGIKIREIYLAYFDPPQPTHFLQPIYVFQGDQNFYGYYPAIPPEWRE